MRSVRLAVVLGALLVPTLIPAQDHRFGAHYNAGGVYFTPLNSGAGSVNGAAAADIELDPGWIVGLQFEQWLGSGRIGWRANGAITERPMSLPGESRDIGVWLADFDLLLRLLPADDRIGNVFVSLGIGALQYRLGRGDLVAYEPANAIYEGREKARLVGAAGIGFDLMTAWSWDGDPIGFRFEVVDHVALTSPFQPLSGSDFSPVHNVRFVVGVFAGWGLLR